MSPREQTLTSRQFAQALGVSESSVKRWVDDGEIAADRTAGGHRRIPVAAAVGFIRRRRAALARPDLLPVSAAPSVGKIDDDAAELLYRALLEDDPAGAQALVTGRYIGGADIAAIADALIQPAFERLGELWKSRGDGVLIEHRAVQTCIRVLAGLAEWFAPAGPKALVAVVAGGPGDPYLLPSMLATLVLQECGVHARNVGPCTPLATLALAAEHYGASFGCLSLSAPPDRKNTGDWAALAGAFERRGRPLLIGGRLSGALPADVRERVHMCASMAELASYATGMVHGGKRAAARGRKR